MQPDAIHIWCLSFTRQSAATASETRCLSEDENARANRFVFERDRTRYVAARTALRNLLGRYLQTDPATIPFTYGACGKPELGGELSGRLRFNLSHAGDWAVYAISGNSEIGIDIEPLNKDIPWRQLAPVVFSPLEQAELSAIPSREKYLAFLRGWTRKEAYVKGHGDGLSLPLDAFDVPLRPIEQQQAVRAANDNRHVDDWWLYPIDPLPGYAAALAVKNRSARISVHRWNKSLASLQQH